MDKPSDAPSWSLLLVDDYVAGLRVLERLLTEEGHQVTTAENGRDALALALERSFDAVVCDLDLPYLDGTEVLAALARARPEMASRVILTTGHPRYDLDGKHVPWIAKPIRFDALLELIRRVVAGP